MQKTSDKDDLTLAFQFLADMIDRISFLLIVIVEIIIMCVTLVPAAIRYNCQDHLVDTLLSGNSTGRGLYLAESGLEKGCYTVFIVYLFLTSYEEIDLMDK